MAFVLFFNVLAIAVKAGCGVVDQSAVRFFVSVFVFVFAMSWITAWAAVALSPQKRRPKARSVVAFPLFSLILSSSVLYTLVLPTRVWKPIPHSGDEK